MQKVLIAVIILLVSLTSLFASERKPIKRVENYLAVLDLESVGKIEKDVVRPLTDSVCREIVKSGKYEVMDRNSIDKVLKEQAFQMTGCTSKECAVKVGELLGVGKIVVGSVGMVGKTYLLSLSLVNVETGKVEQVEDQECRCEVDDLIKLSKQVAGKLMGMEGTVAIVPTTTAKLEPLAAVSAQNKEQACRQTDGRLCDYGDGTVSDKSTGLMWQQRDDGEKRIWDEAVSYCQRLSLAGKNGFRLPNIQELESIVDKTRRNPAINITYFPETKGEAGWLPVSSNLYWSSSPSTYRIPSAYGVFFWTNNGYTAWQYKTDKHYVRCVR